MPHQTDIQWCHSTVNPVMGCAGCPLWPTEDAIISWLVARTGEIGCASRAYIEILWHSNRVPDRVATMSVVIETLAQRVDSSLQAQCRDLRRKGLMLFRCYAGHLTRRFATKNDAYPNSFENPTLFPGRMAKAAKWGTPSDQEQAAKPWLGNRRLVFVSDMGDALSESIDFESLLNEVIVPVIEAKAASTVWLWLTKRPKRMRKFAEWLAARGIAWPQNLVPMCSIVSPHYANAALDILQIPAVAHGFSCEPWSEWIELPDALFTKTSWMILGGESGAAVADHPFDISWARRLRDRCAAASTPFFLKQLGGNVVNGTVKARFADRHGGEWDEWPADLRIREVPRVLLGSIGH